MTPESAVTPVAGIAPDSQPLPSGPRHRTMPGVLWFLVTAGAMLVGLLSLRYALPRVPHPAPLPNFDTHRTGLILHALSAGATLLLGPWQFLTGLRRRHSALHRRLGWAYTACLVVAALSALSIAAHAATGRVAATGFFTLAVAWLVTVSMGIRTIRRGQIAAHRRWMLRCYALTAGAITLRLYLVASIMLQLPFEIAYPAIAWLSWTLNLLAAELWLRRTKFSLHAGPQPASLDLAN